MDGYQRRFGGIGRLFGKEGLTRLSRSHVCVVGIGGVGSWAAEALARSGIGEITLVDLDDVCISNANRQLHALDGELGKPKVEVMERRIRAINPQCTIHAVQSLFLKSTAETILGPRYDAVLDAIDSPAHKCLLIALCRQRGLPIVAVGGAGGRRDPTAIEVTDLAFTTHDRLLQHVRRRLRRDHGFPKGDQPFGVQCVVSREPQVFPTHTGEISCDRAASTDLRLDCNSGFGTASFVTGAFGLVAAARIVTLLTSSAADLLPNSESLSVPVANQPAEQP